MASSCVRGGFDWILWKISSLKGLSSSGTGCPGQWWSHHPWRYLKDVQAWCLGTWFSGGLGSVRLMVGLDDLKDLFQTWMTLWLWVLPQYIQPCLLNKIQCLIHLPECRCHLRYPVVSYLAYSFWSRKSRSSVSLVLYLLAMCR